MAKSAMKIGVIVPLTEEVSAEFEKAKQLGFASCQLTCWDMSLYTKELAEKTLEASRRTGVEISALWCGWPKPAVWDFQEGYATLGLVPPAFRYARMEALLAGSDFGAMLGVTDIVTHVGFIPENPNDPEYAGVVSVVKYIAKRCKQNGQYFLFETGQETPITLKRMMDDSGMDNLGVNLDPANLLLYGKANPVDALDILGPYVRGVHAKDGEYPANGKFLGQEKPLGQGRVNFPSLIARLKDFGYGGPITIEREISGEQQLKDILDAKRLLEELI